MKFLLLFLLLINLCLAYTLNKSYTYEKSTINALDLFPTMSKDFEVLKFPSHLQHFQVSQRRLYELFKREGIILEGDIVGVVKFKRQQHLELSQLKEEIKEYYLKNLPFLDIKKITVASSRPIKKLPKTYKIHFKNNQFKQNKGSFKITTKKSRFFFKFIIDASYSQFQTIHSLRKGSLITTDNTKMVIVPFAHIQGQLISYSDFSRVQSKHYLNKGKVITLKDVMPVYLISKGSIVNVKLIEGNILIDFTATALKNAMLNESIYVKKKDGSKIRVKTIGNNKAIIE